MRADVPKAAAGGRLTPDEDRQSLYHDAILGADPLGSRLDVAPLDDAAVSAAQAEKMLALAYGG